MANSKVTSKQVGREKKEKKDDWRLVPFIPEMIDKFYYENPEDKIISTIDGDQTKPPVSFDYHELLSTHLSEKEKTIIDLYLNEGKTFQEIGDHYKCSRQFIHMIYHSSLRKLKPILQPTKKREQ